MNINGADQIIKKLEKLASEGKLKASRAALLQSANVVKKAAVTKAKAIDDPATANIREKSLPIGCFSIMKNLIPEIFVRIEVNRKLPKGGFFIAHELTSLQFQLLFT